MQEQPKNNSGVPGKGGGALVISLDFELAWGVHDSLGDSSGYEKNLLGARRAVPEMLRLFAEYEVAATWATVGFLFADGREELQAFSPEIRPTYSNAHRDPYRRAVGVSEQSDPLSFAPSLIRQVSETPRQELASHTFSHYYCLDPGQTAEQFKADLDAAVNIAQAKGYALRTLVVPRHQVRQDYLPAVREAGFSVHRTNERNFLNAPKPTGGDSLPLRLLRLADAYAPITGPGSVEWESVVPDENGLSDVRESRFFRPAPRFLLPFDGLRLGRIVRSLRAAARTGSIFHLWWHPHNFGGDIAKSLADLEKVLEAFAQLREDGLMHSFNMGELSDLVRGGAHPG